MLSKRQHFTHAQLDVSEEDNPKSKGRGWQYFKGRGLLTQLPLEIALS